MPGASGIEIAKQIKGKPVIFTTAYKAYAAEAFEIDAIDYVALSAVHYYSQDLITTNIYSNCDKPLVLIIGEAYRRNFILKMKFPSGNIQINRK